jgi:hypothetical protein
MSLVVRSAVPFRTLPECSNLHEAVVRIGLDLLLQLVAEVGDLLAVPLGVLGRQVARTRPTQWGRQLAAGPTELLMTLDCTDGVVAAELAVTLHNQPHPVLLPQLEHV